MRANAETAKRRSSPDRPDERIGPGGRARPGADDYVTKPFSLRSFPPSRRACCAAEKPSRDAGTVYEGRISAPTSRRRDLHRP